MNRKRGREVDGVVAAVLVFCLYFKHILLHITPMFHVRPPSARVRADTALKYLVFTTDN